MTPHDSLSEPVVSWAPASKADYTLIIIDPDSPQIEGEYVHLLRVNIPVPGKAGLRSRRLQEALSHRAANPLTSQSSIHFPYILTDNRIEHPGILMYMKANIWSFKITDFVKVFPIESDPLAGKESMQQQRYSSPLHSTSQRLIEALFLGAERCYGGGKSSVAAAYSPLCTEKFID